MITGTLHISTHVGGALKEIGPFVGQYRDYYPESRTYGYHITFKDEEELSIFKLKYKYMIILDKEEF